MSAKGEINLAPYSFFNGVTDAADRDVLQRRPQGLARLRRGDEGIRLQPRDLGPARPDEPHLGALPARHQRDGAAGLTAAPSRLVKPPRVAAAPCALECKWLQTVALNDVDGTAARRLGGVRPGGRRLHRRPLHQERPARHRRDEADRALRLSRLLGADRELHHAPPGERRRDAAPASRGRKAG